MSIDLLHFAFWPAVERFEAGDRRALVKFVREHPLVEPEMREYVADVLDGLRERGDARKVAREGERLARAFAAEAFIHPNLPVRQIVARIAPDALDAAEKALQRYWKRHGRKPAEATAGLILEGEANRLAAERLAQRRRKRAR